ncbi:MAG TPA: lipoprotein LpqH [Mycobacterium sp.]|nr:lipoprotein LpqH [Mycobacterium sp.]
MRVASPSLVAVACATVAGTLVGCSRGPVIETTVVFDGQTRTISTDKVTCTTYDNGTLLILVDGGKSEVVRVVVRQAGHIVADRVGFRHHELSGFVADPMEVDATKVDDTYRFTGRMPPNPGEVAAHRFEIETTCPAVTEAPPQTPLRPRMG